MMKFLLIASVLLNIGPVPEKVIYKQIGNLELSLEVFRPPDADHGDPRPAMVFFFGGGWNGGRTQQFQPHAEYFSDRGMVCFLVEYRVNLRHGTTPFESLMDAKSAMRYIKANASVFHIDTARIVAAGGSAGGHLAAATAFVEKFNDPHDDLSVSPVPAALALFNPVVDNGPSGYGYDRLGERYVDFSPLHNVRQGAPPSIFFLGTRDKHIPVKTAEQFKRAIERVGGRCDLVLYEGQPHGFFNYRNRPYFQNTVYETDRFLVSLGILEGQPTIDRGTPGTKKE